MTWYLILYILVAILLGGYTVLTLYQRKQTTGAFLAAVLLILVFVFFELRWFNSDGSVKGSSTGKIQWPPIINVCPDFMVSWKDPSGNVYCYDASNIYNMQTGSSSFLTTQQSINGVSGQSAIKMNDTTQGVKASTFSTTPMRWPFYNLLNTSLNTLASDSVGRYLRWEGVWDGNLFTPSAAVPLP